MTCNEHGVNHEHRKLKVSDAFLSLIYEHDAYLLSVVGFTAGVPAIGYLQQYLPISQIMMLYGPLRKLNNTDHPSKPRMNFSRQWKLLWRSNFVFFFPPIPCLDRNRALPRSSQLSKLPKTINHVRRLKFRGGATLRPLIPLKPYFPPSALRNNTGAGHLSPLIFNFINDSVPCAYRWHHRAYW